MHPSPQGYGHGLVDYSEIIRALRRPLSHKRLQWVEQAFNKLAHSNSNDQVSVPSRGGDAI